MEDEERIREAKEFLDGRTGGDAGALEGFKWGYEKSKSPRWLFSAISFSKSGVAETPEWILSALLEAARSVALGVIAGPEIVKKYKIPGSMDKALGITSERGKKSYITSEQKRDGRDDIFRVIEMLRACYEVSVEQACESAYYFRDVERFALASALVDVKEYADEASYSAAVACLRSYDKTLGEGYGATLDTLIDRYHREGAAYREENPRPAIGMMEEWAGELLGMKEVPDFEAWSVPSADARKFRKRPEFQEIADNVGLYVL